MSDLPKITVAVLTRFPDLFAQVSETLRMYAPGLRRVVVVDTSSDCSSAFAESQYSTNGWNVVRTEMPFSAGRNAGIALLAAWPDDVLCMGDDVRLEREGDVELLQRIAYQDAKIGLLSPLIEGRCGNQLQRYPGKGMKTDFLVSQQELVGVCLFIKRAMIDEIGVQDPRFNRYSGDDIDYSRRAMRAGWKLAVTDRVKVVHGFGDVDGTVSFRRMQFNEGEQVAEMQARLIQKYQEV